MDNRQAGFSFQCLASNVLRNARRDQNNLEAGSRQFASRTAAPPSFSFHFRFKTVSCFPSISGTIGSLIGTRARRANPISRSLPPSAGLAAGEHEKRSLIVEF